jgi:hypothetical protein
MDIYTRFAIGAYCLAGSPGFCKTMMDGIQPFGGDERFEVPLAAAICRR